MRKISNRFVKLNSVCVTFLCLLTLFVCGCGNETTCNNEIVVSVKDIDREYDYFLINDTHIFIGDDEIKPEYNELVANRINEFSYEGRPSSQNLDIWLNGLTPKEWDGVILNADIEDQLSKANITFVAEQIDNLSIPCMYLMSDHDLATDWTNPSEEDWEIINTTIESAKLNLDYYTFEEDGFIILGMNRTWQNISEETLESIKKVFEKDKPVIIVTHVPYDSNESTNLSELSKELKGDRVLLWGNLNENYYVPNEYTGELLNMIYEDNSNVVAVIAAHLHTTYTTMLTDSIPEYIVGTGYSGVKTKLRIVPEK